MSGQKADIKFAPLPGKTRSPGVLHNYTEFISNEENLKGFHRKISLSTL